MSTHPGGTVVGIVMTGNVVTVVEVVLDDGGGSVTGGWVTGGAVIGGAVIGGSVTGGSVAGGSVSGGVKTGGDVAGGCGACAWKVGALVAGGPVRPDDPFVAPPAAVGAGPATGTGPPGAGGAVLDVVDGAKELIGVLARGLAVVVVTAGSVVCTAKTWLELSPEPCGNPATISPTTAPDRMSRVGIQCRLTHSRMRRRGSIPTCVGNLGTAPSHPSLPRDALARRPRFGSCCNAVTPSLDAPGGIRFEKCRIRRRPLQRRGLYLRPRYPALAQKPRLGPRTVYDGRGAARPSASIEHDRHGVAEHGHDLLGGL